VEYLENGDQKERCIALDVINVEMAFYPALHLKLLYAVDVCKK
jgi:hypothetical protein